MECETSLAPCSTSVGRKATRSRRRFRTYSDTGVQLSPLPLGPARRVSERMLVQRASPTCPIRLVVSRQVLSLVSGVRFPYRVRGREGVVNKVRFLARRRRTSRFVQGLEVSLSFSHMRLWCRGNSLACHVRVSGSIPDSRSIPVSYNGSTRASKPLSVGPIPATGANRRKARALAAPTPVGHTRPRAVDHASAEGCGLLSTKQEGQARLLTEVPSGSDVVGTAATL